jgi:hypothetical protein
MAKRKLDYKSAMADGTLSRQSAQGVLDQASALMLSKAEIRALNEYLSKSAKTETGRCWCGMQAIPGDNVCHFHNPS